MTEELVFSKDLALAQKQPTDTVLHLEPQIVVSFLFQLLDVLFVLDGHLGPGRGDWLIVGEAFDRDEGCLRGLFEIEEFPHDLLV